MTARCRGTGAVERPRWPAWEVGDPAEPRTSRQVRFVGSGPLDTPVYERERLALGQTIAGPALVEEWTTTIVVPPGWRASTDRLGDLVMERT